MKRKVWIIGVILIVIGVFFYRFTDEVLSRIGSVASIIGLVVSIITSIWSINSKTNDHLHLTSLPMDAGAKNVIGRKQDLKRLWKTLSKQHHIILTGFGGIGKTKLAQWLFHEYEKKFDEVAWIDYQGDLKKSFLSSINALQSKGNEKKRWEAMKNALINDGKKKLFIIDNVDGTVEQHPEQDAELRNLTGWKNTTVLLTSRLEKLTGYESISLDSLELDNCVKLFNLYYIEGTPDRETVVNIVELANRHTMTIELLAKGAGRKNLEEYYKELKNNGFEKIDRKIDVDHYEEKAKIEHHLRILFDMQQRSGLDKQILNSFAILPEKCSCSLEEIGQWFGFKDDDLDDVINDGWLRYDKDSKTYSLHPLVRTIVRFDFQEDEQNNKTIAPGDIADRILKYFENCEGWDDIAQGYQSLQRQIDIVNSAMGAVTKEENERFATLFNGIGYSYKSLGDYDKALEYFQKAIEIYEKVLGKEHPDTATSYNNIGAVYCKQGNYVKALNYHFKALAIRDKVLGSEHPDTAQSYNNIGMVYDEQSNYGEALVYYLKALPIIEKSFGTEYPNTASLYDNIGSVYRMQNDYGKALEYLLKALAIREKVLVTEHPDTATTYTSIGLVYYDQRDYDKALQYHKKALAIREKVLGTEHPDTAQSYNNIGGVYYAQGDYQKALEHFDKAYSILMNVLGPQHPNTRTFLENTKIAKQAMNLSGKTKKSSFIVFSGIGLKE